MLRTVRLDIHLREDQVQRYYTQSAHQIKGYTHTGERIYLPFDILINFVSHDGIHGTFELTYQESGLYSKNIPRGKFVSIKKIA